MDWYSKMEKKKKKTLPLLKKALLKFLNWIEMSIVVTLASLSTPSANTSIVFL